MRDLKSVFPILCAAALTLALFGGCAPTITSQSNLAPDYRADLDRIFFVLDTQQLDDTTRRINYRAGDFAAEVADTSSFTTWFMEELVLACAAVNVEHEVYRVTGLELSENEIKNRVAAFGPDAELWVREAWFGVMRDTGILGLQKIDTVTAIDLDTFLFADPDSEEPVWRATLKIESGRGGVTEMARKLAETLVAQLVEDGLIDPAAAK